MPVLSLDFPFPPLEKLCKNNVIIKEWKLLVTKAFQKLFEDAILAESFLFRGVF